MANPLVQEALAQFVPEGFDLNRQKDRIFLAEKSLLLFCLIYLGNHFSLEPADFHRELIEVLQSEELDDQTVVIIGFRGSAKSTIASLAYPLWLSLFAKFHFIILINETGGQMELNISNIKKEFEDNVGIKRDFPHLNPEGGSQWQKTKLEFSNGVLILGRSRGQKIRGLKHRQYRPQVIIGDDLEDLEYTRKQENRDKTERWFNAEVVPAQEETKCKLVIIGNMLHNDAIMARLKKRKIYEVQEFPLVTDEGEITWKGKYPDMEAVERQRKKINSVSAWSREYLLKVISEEDQIVKEHHIAKYPNSILSEMSADGYPTYKRLDGGCGIDFAISEKKKADSTAMVRGAKVKYNGKTRILVLPNPVNRKLTFNEIIQTAKNQFDGLPMGSKMYAEDVAFQKGAIQEMNRKGIPTTGLRPISDKRARLETVSGYIEDGTVMFPETGCEELLTQLLNFGAEEHDDLVDALVYMIFGLVEARKGARTVGKVDKLPASSNSTVTPNNSRQK